MILHDLDWQTPSDLPSAPERPSHVLCSGGSLDRRALPEARALRGPGLPPYTDETPSPSACIRDFPIHPCRQPSLPPVGIRRSGIDELLSRAVSRIKPHFEGHGRVARALLKFENGFIGSFRASVWNGHGRCQDLGLIRIPNLDDVPVGRAIGQSEDVRSRRQNLPGDFHRIAEGNDGFSVPLIRSSARGECGPKQNSDQHSAQRKYSYSQILHATTLLVGLAGRAAKAR